ncbi:hypothetical protein DUNSADRAFT_1007 [Dunaliella salina]|uniref:Encoded protein n=1 Tax=Dunaliella salina TaxID=3046 RepID=A0ABQ7FY38_DUNSA|nr:hypothetical protein DUNSADRAFT_1007 [Dunaliella salina]|eukprot:KAF5827280.1 hypothetical protein DUNSADRAFT_1007 [Dunaliella salina]
MPCQERKRKKKKKKREEKEKALSEDLFGRIGAQISACIRLFRHAPLHPRLQHAAEAAFHPSQLCCTQLLHTGRKDASHEVKREKEYKQGENKQARAGESPMGLLLD